MLPDQHHLSGAKRIRSMNESVSCLHDTYTLTHPNIKAPGDQGPDFVTTGTRFANQPEGSLSQVC